MIRGIVIMSEKENKIKMIVQKYSDLAMNIPVPENADRLDGEYTERFKELTKQFRQEITEVEKEYGKG